MVIYSWIVRLIRAGMVFLSALLLFCPTATLAGGLEILDLRLGGNKNDTRIVIEMNKSVDFDVFTLATPYRAVIDLPAADWKIADPAGDRGLVNAIRYGLFSENQSRVVADLKRAAKVEKKFILSPSASSANYRLVVDLVSVTADEFTTRQKPSKPAQTKRVEKLNPPIVPPRSFVPQQRPENDRNIVVVDPGHGGVDPGAIGRKTKEKDVVLAFSRLLVDKLRATGRYDVHLTRKTDIYIPLRERVQIARRKKADLFISIHADAIRRKNVRGLSVYTLSEKASDREAAALARKENQSDVIAGIDFGDQPPDVTNILIDLAQRETKNHSKRFASHVVEKARGETLLLERTHRQAGFRVLKAPDVPSVLIELGFLTNRLDEKQILSTQWQHNIATALSRAIDAYFDSKMAYRR